MIAAVRHAANLDPADLEHEVFHGGFERFGRTLQEEPPRCSRGQRHRVADLEGAATAGGDKRERDVPAVAGSNAHAVDGPPEAVRDDLRDECLVALALRSAADEDVDSAIRKNDDARGLGHPDACGLNAHGDANPDGLAGQLALAD